MSLYSKEKEYEFKSKIRQILVKKPDVTILETKELLHKHNIDLDKNYIGKLINKIRKERAYNINNYTMNKVLAELADEIGELKKKMWLILDSSDAKYRDKIAASKEIREQANTLIDKMFDGGVFERKLGTMKNVIKPSMEEEVEVERMVGLANLRGDEATKQYTEDETISQQNDTPSSNE